MFLAENAKGFKRACSVFDVKEVAQLDFSDLLGLLPLCAGLSDEHLKTIKSISQKVSLCGWLKLFPPFHHLVNEEKSNLNFCLKNASLVTFLLESKISLEDIAHSIIKIRGKGYFANLMLENFKLLCKIGNLSPIEILKIDLKRFVYLLAKAQDIENQFKSGIFQQKSIDFLFVLSMEEVHKLLPCSSEEWRAFARHKVVKAYPDSKDKIRELAYNICPCNKTEATLNEITGGPRKPLFTFICSALDGEMKNNGHVYDKNQAAKLKNLHSLLTFARDIEFVYNRAQVVEETHLPDRIEARNEIATQTIVTKLKELQGAESSENARLIFPGGWLHHAIIYGIEFDAKTQKYVFSIWDTGEGLSYHHELSSEGKVEVDAKTVSDFNDTNDKYQIRAEWSNLEFEQVADHSFLRLLLEEKTQGEISNANRIYPQIRDQFGKDQDPISKDPARFHHAQKDGNCGWKSLWAASADLLGREQDPLFALRIKSVIIDSLKRVVFEKIPKEGRASIDEIQAEAIEIKAERVKKKAAMKPVTL